MKYSLVICEVFCKKIHGYDDKFSDPNVVGCFLCVEKNLEKGLLNNMLATIIPFLKARTFLNNHEYIRNYSHIVHSSLYMLPQIAQIIYLSGGECICILKTFWLKCVQRCWKREFANGKKCIKGMFWQHMA